MPPSGDIHRFVIYASNEQGELLDSLSDHATREEAMGALENRFQPNGPSDVRLKDNLSGRVYVYDQRVAKVVAIEEYQIETEVWRISQNFLEKGFVGRDALKFREFIKEKIKRERNLDETCRLIFIERALDRWCPNTLCEEVVTACQASRSSDTCDEPGFIAEFVEKALNLELTRADQEAKKKARPRRMTSGKSKKEGSSPCKT